MKDQSHFDYAIIGAGAAGLQLALAFIADPHFAEKRILILDKDVKDKNDRTWCYWEKGEGPWDALITRAWNQASFITDQQQLEYKLSPYQYKMLRSADFYRYAKEQVARTSHVKWVNEEVKDTIETQVVAIKTDTATYFADHVFDSRVPVEFYSDTAYTHILQHFKGWVIQTHDQKFDTDQFTMMDFRTSDKSTTNFMYVLPLSDNQAMVEHTYFSSTVVADDVYEQELSRYISEILKIDEYQIIETEYGVIPMSDYPFNRHHSKLVTKIGTAGGWVKASTGYSFKNASRHIDKIIKRLKKGRIPHRNHPTGKYQFYDRVFLKVLADHNHRGAEFFEKMYTKNSIQRIFRFLDNKSSLQDDAMIIKSFPALPFLKAAFAKRG